MGYRSEVAIAFYSKSEEHSGVIKLWMESNFPYEDWKLYEDAVQVKESPAYTFVFHIDHIKWYEGYTEVERMNKLIEDFAELFCGGGDPVAACEFMRSGEGDDDIESEQYGDVDHVLSITKSISVNI
jgi:hypothetical protein